jgi:hypothetical protein
MIKGETKFWHEIKAFNIKNNCELSFTRVENSAAHGTPDLLVYNNSGHFFTIELKLISTKKIRFSPHQIGFHIKHPHNAKSPRSFVHKTLWGIPDRRFNIRFCRTFVHGP